MAKEDNKTRILLAEDHHVVRAAVAALLAKEADMKVVGEVSDGSTLLTQVEALRPNVVLFDAQMPNHKPVQAAKALQQQFPDVAILVLSAYDLPEYVVGLLQAGAAGYVLKDDPSEMLVQAVRTVAQGKEFVSPRATRILVETMRQQPADVIDRLTPRETEVLQLMAQGFTNSDIAEQFVLSEQTVRNHVSNIFSKLGAKTRVEAVLYAIANDLVSTQQIKDDFSK